MQATWGPGVGRYVNDLPGQGLDGQVDPLTGNFDLVEATGWNASYEHWFNEVWLSNFTYANVHVDNNINQPLTTYDSATYLAASLWCIPMAGMSWGMEYLWGERESRRAGRKSSTDPRPISIQLLSWLPVCRLPRQASLPVALATRCR